MKNAWTEYQDDISKITCSFCPNEEPLYYLDEEIYCRPCLVALPCEELISYNESITERNQ